MVDFTYDIYSAMQEGKPLASYKKVILGAVRVVVLNPFNDSPEEVILKGDPNDPKQVENCIVDVWDNKQKSFFERMNAFHLKKGNIVSYVRPEEESTEINYNALTDDEISELLDKGFMALKHALDRMTEEAAVLRVLRIAQEKDKSNKIISKIEERISELQGGE